MQARECWLVVPGRPVDCRCAALRACQRRILILATIHVPQEYVGNVLSLCQDRRGVQRDMAMHGSRAQVRYEIPLAEVVAAQTPYWQLDPA